MRGGRDSGHHGHYRVQGGHIEYRDENGYTVGGDFRDGLLYQAGMVLYQPAR
ncbi:MAG: Atu4866 domain-containing protein [Solimonas sp.]